MNQQISKLIAKLNELSEARTPVELVEIEVQGNLNMNLLGSPIIRGASAIDPLLVGKLEAYSDSVMLFSYKPNMTDDPPGSTGSGLKRLTSGAYLNDLGDGKLEKAAFLPLAGRIGDSIVRTPSEANPTYLKYHQDSPAPYNAFSSLAPYWGSTDGFDGDFPWRDKIIVPGVKAWYSSNRIKGEYPEAEAWAEENYDAELRFGYYYSDSFLSRDWSSDEKTLAQKPVSPLRPISGYHCHTMSIKTLGGKTDPNHGLGTWSFYVKGAGPDTYEAYYAGATPRVGSTDMYAYAKPLYSSGVTAANASKPLAGPSEDVGGGGSGTGNVGGDDSLAMVLRVLGGHPTLDIGFQNGSVIAADVEDVEVDGRTVKIRKFIARPKLVTGSITKKWYEDYHATGLGIWETRPEKVRAVNMETWGKVTTVNFRFEMVNCAGNSVKQLPAYAQYGRQRAKACKHNDFLTRSYDEFSTWGQIDQELSQVKALSLWLSRNWGSNIIYSDAPARQKSIVVLTKFGDGSISGVNITVGSSTESFATSELQKEAAIEFMGTNDPVDKKAWNDYLSSGVDDQTEAVAEFDRSYVNDLSAKSLGSMDMLSRSALINTSKPFVNDQSEQSLLYLIHQFGEFSSLRAGIPKLLSSFSYTSLVKVI